MVAARNPDLDAAIALTRFSMGAKPGELRAVGGDARAYLKAQIRTAGADQPADPPGGKLLPTIELWKHDFEARRLKRTKIRENRADGKAIRRHDYEVEFLARIRLGTETAAGFRERWALFWCNHFSTTRRAGHTEGTVGSFEREAIRPRVFGRFADMLLATSHHPTMLLYLDQAKSFGPNSQAGVARRKGLNENLAREIMELHTLGVDAGYTQADVTEFARALTGWTVHRQEGHAEFHDRVHEPGARRIFGKTYAQEGVYQANAVLKDFAANPHTAHHIATKLARHFVADIPPPALVAKLESAYRESDGRLDHVAEALVTAPEAWDTSAQKVKTAYDFLVSSWRAAGATPTRFADVGKPIKELGQEGFKPPSPKGWDEEAENWASSGEILERIEWAGEFADQHAPQGDPVKQAREVLGARLAPASATAISRAESRDEAFALLLMTPEFQRR